MTFYYWERADKRTKIAIEYFITLVQKYELAGSVVQRAATHAGIIKSENDQWK